MSFEKATREEKIFLKYISTTKELQLPKKFLKLINKGK